MNLMFAVLLPAVLVVHLSSSRSPSMYFFSAGWRTTGRNDEPVWAARGVVFS